MIPPLILKWYIYVILSVLWQNCNFIDFNLNWLTLQLKREENEWLCPFRIKAHGSESLSKYDSTLYFYRSVAGCVSWLLITCFAFLPEYESCPHLNAEHILFHALIQIIIFLMFLYNSFNASFAYSNITCHKTCNAINPLNVVMMFHGEIYEVMSSRRMQPLHKKQRLLYNQRSRPLVARRENATLTQEA